jgi:KEOPS complex subunit Cgi121
MDYEILAGKATVESVEAFLNDIDVIAHSSTTTIQPVDASKVADREHVELAVRQSLRSFTNGRNIASNLGVEILLHLSASRQIRKALNLGLKRGEMDVLFVIVGTKQTIESSAQKLHQLIVVDSRVVDYRDAKREALMQTFNITEEEVRAAGGSHRIPELVRERLALFNAYK